MFSFFFLFVGLREELGACALNTTRQLRPPLGSYLPSKPFFLVFKYFVSDDDFLDTSAKSCGYFLFSLDIFFLQREVCVETVQSGKISLGISCR